MRPKKKYNKNFFRYREVLGYAMLYNFFFNFGKHYSFAGPPVVFWVWPLVPGILVLVAGAAVAGAAGILSRIWAFMLGLLARPWLRVLCRCYDPESWF
jgi:hypothetical protein